GSGSRSLPTAPQPSCSRTRDPGPDAPQSKDPKGRRPMTTTMTTTVPLTTESGTPHWRGINHIALVTTDMDATVRFYHGTLGARLVATLGNAAFRHYFFEFGPQCTVAFFEHAEGLAEPFAKPAGAPDARAPQ